MRYLITGGAGFIGSHLGEASLAPGDEVHVLDDLSTGRSTTSATSGGPAVRLHASTPSIARRRGRARRRGDVVFHLAAAVGVKLIVESPVRTIETNVHGTEVVLAQANKKKKPVLVASTTEVYGKSTQLPVPRGRQPRHRPDRQGAVELRLLEGDRRVPGARLLAGERLPVVVVRLFNTVGPRQTGRYGMVVPTFVQQALAGGPITVYGDGTQPRCFAHVADVVEALAGLMDTRRRSGRSSTSAPTEEVTDRRSGRAGQAMPPVPAPRSSVPYDEAYEEGFEDMPRRVPDITKIDQLLGWSPTQPRTDPRRRDRVRAHGGPIAVGELD